MNSYFALTFLLIACLAFNSDARRSREREVVRLSELIKFSYRFDKIEREADHVETRSRHRIAEREFRNVDQHDHEGPGDVDTYTEAHTEAYTEFFTVTEAEAHTEFYTEEYMVTESEYFTATETEIYTEIETESESQFCFDLSMAVDTNCFTADTCPTTVSPACCQVMTNFTNANCTDDTALFCQNTTTLNDYLGSVCSIVVTATTNLQSVTQADFNENAQAAFKKTMATTAGVDQSKVTIKNIGDLSSKQGGISVTTVIIVASAAAANQCQAGLADTTSFVALLNVNFRSSGVSIVLDVSLVSNTVTVSNPLVQPSATSSATRSATHSPSASPSPSPSTSATVSPTASTTASITNGASPSVTSSNTASGSTSASASVSSSVAPSTTPSASVAPSTTTSTSAAPSTTPSATSVASASPSNSLAAAAQSGSSSPSPTPSHAVIHANSGSRSAMSVTVVLAMIVAIFI